MVAQGRRHLDQEIRRDAISFPGIAMVLLNAPFRVIAVTAHVPLPDRAVEAGLGIGPANYPHDEVPGGEARTVRGFQDFAEGLVAESQSVGAGRRPTVVAGDYLDVGPAHPDRPGLHQHRAVFEGRFGKLGQVYGVGLQRDNSDGVHD